MSALREFFASRAGIISVGAFIGIFAALLQKWGNPGNMGICVACFERDIAGSIGLHRVALVQYLRPEILGFVLGPCSPPLPSRNSGPGPVPPPSSASSWACWP